eukprot:TRINITY_DN5162_c0_g1_i1.p1 TRINITY_DN5162_c0_g1~~TRINITY_DN5162_c0_g1_i1.p1  ORF type:complete len:138 (-),score=17.45 TRINITY_DN5162_c0_g1_i1:86-499(-)
MCIRDRLYSAVDAANDPAIVESRICYFSQECLTYITEYFCSSLCPSCKDDDDEEAVLLPCSDVCDRYNDCRDNFKDSNGDPCLPELPYPCAQTNSAELDSASTCTYINANFDKIPDDYSHASSLSSVFKPALFFFRV